MKNDNKKILIISHNPLSEVYNNGKTLVSIFKGVPEKNIYQIYLNADQPDYSEECHYLQINEKQIISSIIHRNNHCCKEIKPGGSVVSGSTVVKTKSFAINTKRLLREVIWKTGIWKTNLNEWLKDKTFDVVFFMAGDGLFAYDVYRFVMERISAKGCLFFTDDYVIGRPSYSPIALLRQLLLKKKIKKSLMLVDELYVISDEMKKAYAELFGRDGYVIRNYSIEKAIIVESKQIDSEPKQLVMVYAGGLHYNRWEILSRIARALEKINRSNDIKCILKIYSAQNISSDIVDRIAIDGASEFCGSASSSEIANIYANADILLHVESFDKKSIAFTKYSFSTKIPEYLSAEKCVFAVGPADVASIEFLSGFACVGNEDSDLLTLIKGLLNDEEYRGRIKSNCKEKYEKEFSEKKQQDSLDHILSVS